MLQVHRYSYVMFIFLAFVTTQAENLLRKRSSSVVYQVDEQKNDGTNPDGALLDLLGHEDFWETAGLVATTGATGQRALKGKGAKKGGKGQDADEEDENSYESDYEESDTGKGGKKGAKKQGKGDGYESDYEESDSGKGGKKGAKKQGKGDGKGGKGDKKGGKKGKGKGKGEGKGKGAKKYRMKDEDIFDMVLETSMSYY